MEFEHQDLKEGQGVKLDDNFELLISVHYREVSEILAHLFDFVYFYQQDHQSYINSIWSSWDVIPNVDGRIEEYLTRTLCAIHFANLTVQDSVATSVAQLTAGLERLSATSTNDLYVTKALVQLKRDKKRYIGLLDNRLFLVKLAKVLLYSAEVAKIFEEQRPESRRARETISASTPKQFIRNRRVDNPLRFIADVSKDRVSDPLKSVWLLTQLAFARRATDA